MKHKKFQFLMMLAPIIIFVGLLFFLWRGLYIQPDILPSALIGKPAPRFHVTNLLAPAYPFTEQDLRGHVTLLNFWASWCSSCEREHHMLMEIGKKYHIAIYGIAYKDSLSDIKLFLRVLGNPFTIIGNDSTGEVAMDFGVYGTPETFIVNKKGIIVHRHVGVIDQRVWEDELLPVIRQN